MSTIGLATFAPVRHTVEEERSCSPKSLMLHGDFATFAPRFADYCSSDNWSNLAAGALGRAHSLVPTGGLHAGCQGLVATKMVDTSSASFVPAGGHHPSSPEATHITLCHEGFEVQ